MSLSTPCDGFFHEERLEVSARVCKLSTPCDGFGGRERVVVAYSGGLSTPCDGFWTCDLIYDEADGLSTPCDGFTETIIGYEAVINNAFNSM